MANYSVDIEVALRGVEKLREFERILTRSVAELEKLERALKKVKQQNPYDVSGAKRVTEQDKLRNKIIKKQNELLSEQERILRRTRRDEARERLAAQVEARRNPPAQVRMRPIAGIAYPEGAGPGMGPNAQRNIDRARMQRYTNRVNAEKQLEEEVARIQRRFMIDANNLELGLIQKELEAEIDKIEAIGAARKKSFKEELGEFDAKLAARTKEKNLAERTAKADAKRRNDAVSSAIIGGAFPLLFGQGIGASVGGAAGGGLGGLAGGQMGFGLSLVGTALGSAFDQLADGAREAALALRDPINNFSELKSRSIIASAAQERYIETLISSGQIVKANAEIQREVISKIGAGGVRDFQSLAAAQSKLSRATGEFVLQLQAALAGPLAGLTSWLAGFLAVANTARRSRMVTEGGIPTDPAERARFEQEVLKSYNKVFGTGFTDVRQGRGQLEGQSGFLGYLASSPEGRKELARIQEMFPGKQDAALTAEAEKRAKLEDGLTKSLQMQAVAEGLRLDIAKQTNLTSAKDRELAAKALNDLDYEIAKEGIRLQMLRDGYNEERNHALHTSAALQHQARAAAIAEQQRQQQIAERQQFLGLLAQEQQLHAQSHSLHEQINSLGVTQEKALENRLVALKSQHAFQQTALLLEHKSVQESDEYRKNKVEIDRVQKLQTENLTRQQNLEVAQVNRQRELLALSRMRADQERQLQFAQTEAGFQSQLAGAGISQFVGPFAGSAQAEQQMALDFALEVKNKQLEIKQISDQIRMADGEERKQLEERRQGLQNLLALYQEYQPQINAATLEQQRFNEALQFTQPVVDGVFQSLTSVVDGTKTAQQAFADFLNAIAKMLVDVAVQMIATYIAIGVARMFAGMPSSAGNTPAPDIQSGADFGLGNQIMVGGMRTAASGKGAIMNQPYLVGERGPELFVPKGNGTIVPNHQTGMGGSNIVVNVDASGSSVEGKGDDQKRLGEAIGIAVRQELIKQQRPGGLLA